MRNKLFGTIIIVNSLFYIHNTWSSSTIEEIKANRKSTRESFLQYANQINSCSDKLNSLSWEAQDIQNITSERTKACQSPVSTLNQYNKCLNLTNNILSRTRSLQKSISETKKLCPSFSSSGLLKQNLTSSINDIQMSLNDIGDEGLGYWVSFFKESEKETYDKYKPNDCKEDIIKISQNLAVPMFEVKVAANNIGDIYRLNKAISQLKIVKDYASIMEKTCSKEGFNLPADINTREQMNKTIAEIQNEVQEITKIVDDLVSRFGNPDFDALSEKICEKFKEINKDDRGLCENPIDTPEWSLLHTLYHLQAVKKSN